jgi:plasmid stabilization system protein ParE
MATLIYDPLALLEIRDAAAYYNECREGLGRAFLEEIEKDMRRLAVNPLLYRNIGSGFRRCLVKRFPYGIIYRIDNDTIFIAAVMHLKREPGYWKERLQD